MWGRGPGSWDRQFRRQPGYTLTCWCTQLPTEIRTSFRYWNAVILFGFFLVTAVILSRLKAAYREVADREKNRVRRYKHPLTLAYMDIDNFKVINDRFGHQIGDVLLVWVAKMINRNLRATDFVARVGGDEFAILLPETGAEA